MKSKFLTMKFILGALILSFSCACSNSNSEEAMPQTAIGRQLVESHRCLLGKDGAGIPGPLPAAPGYEGLFQRVAGHGGCL